MTYANDLICWDADSHLMPTTGLLSKHADVWQAARERCHAQNFTELMGIA